MKRLFFILTILSATLTAAVGNGIALTDTERAFVTQNSDFAFRLFRQVRNNQEPMANGQQPSLVLSPLSITYALGMLNNGATGETQEQINKVLGSVGADASQRCSIINSFCRKMIDASSTLDEKTKVLIADNIYVNEARGYHLLPDFVQAAADYYDATPETRDFFDGETRNAINQWASDHTEGMIKEPLKESEFDPMVISYLLNALYFKSEWALPFDKKFTQEMPFDGQEGMVDMMRQQEMFEYATSEVCQSVRLPYGNGAFQMTVLLPHAGKSIDDVIGFLGYKEGNDEQDSWDPMTYKPYQVNLQLPRFETDTDQRLEEIMKALGMPRAFNPNDAQFDEFAAKEGADDPIYISFMKQVAKIRVNESGTEAAAVTVIGMKDNAVPEQQYAEFIADRPFLYIISERSTGTIFFIGQFMGTGEEKKTNELEKPMLVQGKTWHYTYHHFEDKEEPTGDNYPEDFYDETLYEVSYTVKGDTIIDGQNYVKIYRRDPKGGSKYYAALREDEEGRVWQYDGDHWFEGDEYPHVGNDFMLCDVTCSSYPGPENGAISDVVKIGSNLLHRYFWEGLIGVEGVGLEGKGLIHYPFGPEPDCICDYETFAYVTGGVYFTASDFRAPKYIQLTEDEKQMVMNNNDFAFRLFREARNYQSSIINYQPSMLLSPLSITYALGLANNGAAGQTQQEICNVLGFNDVNVQNEFCHKMLNELSGTGRADATTKTNIANTIFVNRGLGYQLDPDFDHWVRYYYYATPQSRDFADGETRDVINQWASDKTEGMIKEVLKEPEFNPMAVSYLLNAIYFKGMWSCPFKAENTREEAFNGGDAVPMMHQESIDLEYAENELCQSVVLPYGNGTYRMQVFLPREGKTLDEMIESMNGNNWQMHGGNYEVDLKLPRYDTTTDTDLKTIMSALGMPTAFSPYEADFSRLCVDNFGENIYIGMMKQVAKIEVNEQGTEAAAVTVIGYETTGMPDRATFHANRPFLYIISEQSTGIILFMGQYVGNSTADTVQYIAMPSQQTEQVYDLQGRKMTGTALPRGLYVVDGKKMVVK